MIRHCHEGCEGLEKACRKQRLTIEQAVSWSRQEAGSAQLLRFKWLPPTDSISPVRSPLRCRKIVIEVADDACVSDFNLIGSEISRMITEL
jgi:hypothetical protein